jgi:menaquinone-dependent protoporphyrinogen oxidase
MRILVTWGSKRGGTAGIGTMIAETLTGRGFDVVAAPVERVPSLDGFNAVIIGGSLYANLWPWKVRRFMNRNLGALRSMPVWTFSSGPLDASAEKQDIPPTRAVSILLDRVGAQGHVTFGGRLEPTVKGFPASAMARARSGDWRNPDGIRAWAAGIADALPAARPGRAVEQPAHSLLSLCVRPVVGWALCAALMTLLQSTLPLLLALVIHAVAAPLVFVALAVAYFRNRGAREPLPTASAWTSIVMVLDAVIVAGLLQRSVAMFASLAGTWLPFALIFASVFGTGYLMSMWPEPQRVHGAAT